MVHSVKTPKTVIRIKLLSFIISKRFWRQVLPFAFGFSLFLQAMYKLVPGSHFTTFVRNVSRVNRLQTNIKPLPLHSPRNRHPYVKYGTLACATGAAAFGLYYSQLTNHEKRIVRVTASGMSRFARLVLLLTSTLFCSSWSTLCSHSVTWWKLTEYQSINQSIGVCRMRWFLAVLRSLFHSSLS
jgi:multisubunit Na+/H+ antiporter MnhB subunit